jgi:hypothetical protein
MDCFNHPMSRHELTFGGSQIFQEDAHFAFACNRRFASRQVVNRYS